MIRTADDVWDELTATANNLKEGETLLPSPAVGTLNEIVGVEAERIRRYSERRRSGEGGDATKAGIRRLWERLLSRGHARGLRFSMALMLTIRGVGLKGSDLVFTDRAEALRWYRPRPMHYWALFANPLTYRIDDAVRDLAEDSWTTRGRDIQAGDRVLFWRGAGRDRQRGPLTLGEVLSDPHENEVESKYWAGQRRIPGPTVRIRYVGTRGLPQLFASEIPEPWSRLSVSRARGGTVFEIGQNDWADVLDASGGWPSEVVPEITAAEASVSAAAGRRRASTGWRLSSEERRAIERHAVERAMKYFRDLGYEVLDVGAYKSWDLECRKGEADLHVEVKGTQTAGEAIVLTRLEVEHAYGPHPCALVVVSNIDVRHSREGDVLVSGGQVAVWNPWNIDSQRLTPVGFTYVVGPPPGISDAG